MADFFFSTTRKLTLARRERERQLRAHQPAIPDPGQAVISGGKLLRSMLCHCGTAWSLTRIPTRHLVSEQMCCPCGETLLQWAECADYIFEPIAPSGSPAN